MWGWVGAGGTGRVPLCPSWVPEQLVKGGPVPKQLAYGVQARGRGCWHPGLARCWLWGGSARLLPPPAVPCWL